MKIRRILVVGLGSIGKRHVRVLRGLLPNAYIIALVRSPRTIVDLTEINEIVNTLQDAISLRPEIAVICNPSSIHLVVATQLASAGIHLLIEKPISNSTHEVTKFIEKCSTYDICIMVGYNLRFLNSLEVFRRMLHEGAINRVTSFRVEVGQNLALWRPSIDYRNSVSASLALGGGVLLELSHELDYIEWIFGEVEWVIGAVDKKSNLEIDVEDIANILMQVKKGGNDKTILGALTMDFFRHDTTRSITAIGEGGTLIWDCVAKQIKFLQKGLSDWKLLQFSSDEFDESYRREWEYFLNCIDSERKPHPSPTEGRRTLMLIDAVRLSSKTGSKVYLAK